MILSRMPEIAVPIPSILVLIVLPTDSTTLAMPSYLALILSIPPVFGTLPPDSSESSFFFLKRFFNGSRLFVLAESLIALIRFFTLLTASLALAPAFLAALPKFFRCDIPLCTALYPLKARNNPVTALKAV